MNQFPDQLMLFHLSRAVHAGESETAIASTVSGIFVGSNSAG